MFESKSEYYYCLLRDIAIRSEFVSSEHLFSPAAYHAGLMGYVKSLDQILGHFKNVQASRVTHLVHVA